MTRNEIREKVEGLLTNDTRVNFERCQLDIDIDGGIVTLSGSVPTVAAKR
ncbi:MAG: BON domain-containing protein, partial [Desulfuromonadales bacterium]|nr:BON domain-containing protein [Desulfuromonadales bacterium]NIR32971.1 BON domain-containing protein [Desulfuromonadales bacterium]NIS40529.1 BON domain-containing protein [Desulfuromonadales bacterium]